MRTYILRLFLATTFIVAVCLCYPTWAQDDAVGLKDGFAAPPIGYGEVPFWWWTGEELNVERLIWQVDQLASKGISGVQVNYAHQDVRNDVQPNWLTYPNEPEVLTDRWFDVFEQVAAHCRELNMGVGLSGYTLDWQNSPGNLFDRLIYHDRETQSRTLRVAYKRQIAAGEKYGKLLEQNGVLAESETDVLVQVVGYPIDASGRLAVERPIFFDNAERYEDVAPENTEIWVYRAQYEPQTLNPLHPDSGRKVVERFFQPFEERAKKAAPSGDDGRSDLGLNYFFQDELQLGTGETIWADDVAKEFAKRKGYSYWTAAPAMFNAKVGDLAEKYRLDYMDLRVRLAEERYFMPIYSWNAQRGRIYACDPGSRGKDPSEFCDYFSAIRWYTAPGHDTPGGHADFIKNKVSSSIAHFYQRPRVWLEGYHSFGWGAEPKQLFFATNENFLYGANLLNLHGLYYTTYGGYWEWAPPCYHFRQPYWETFGAFLKYFERLSFALTRGTEQTDFVVLYPVSAYQSRLNGGRAREVAFEAATRIFASGRDVLFIDDDSIARAEVRNGKLCVAGSEHSVLVLPSTQGIRWKTLEKAVELYESGGTVVALDALPIASERAGRNDEVLNACVRKIFGNADPSSKPNVVNRAKSGGVGAFFAPHTASNADRSSNDKKGSNGTVSKLRQYPGGFAGHWVWHADLKKDVYFKWVVSGLSDETREYPVRLFCDNSSKLFVNDKQICDGANYDVGWNGRLSLRNGDVVTIDGHDDDTPRRGSAGMFFALVDNEKTLVTAEDFRCSADKPTQKWRTDASDFESLEPVDVGNVHVLHRTGVNTEISGVSAQTDDRQNAARMWTDFEAFLKEYPRDVFDVKSDAPCSISKRRLSDADLYFVMKAKKGASLAFRSCGKAEFLNPWDGSIREVVGAVQADDLTIVRWPYEEDEAGLIVFWKNEQPSVSLSSLQTNVDELVSLNSDSDGVWTARAFGSSGEGVLELTTSDGKKRSLKGNVQGLTSSLDLDGDWNFELIPTLDNRWGDFRLPISEQKLGAEAQRFDVENVGNFLNDFGRKFWKLGPFPNDVDLTELDARLGALKNVDPTKPFEFSGKSYQWEPYSFSWRWGIEGNPGHEGYHGLKEKIDSRFIGLGKSSEVLNETTFASEEGGSIYYLWSTLPVKQLKSAENASVIPVDVYVSGGAPDAVFVNGQHLTFDADIRLTLSQDGDKSSVLLRYNTAGRRACCFVARRPETDEKNAPTRLIVADGLDSGAFNGTATGLREELPDFMDKNSKRTPLSTIWFDLDGVLDYDVFGRTPEKAQRQRLSFVAPPGLKSMEIPSYGTVRSISIDGTPAKGTCSTKVVTGPDFWQGLRTSVQLDDRTSNLGAFSSRDVQTTSFELTNAVARESTIVVEFESTSGVYDGAICPEPIRLRCETGVATLGDWNGRGVLENYSGGARYAKSFEWSVDPNADERVTLQLGNVGVSCRVFVNGRQVGDLPTPPWSLEIGDYLKNGENLLEVFVYSSLANYYHNIPSRYKSAPVSGLLGPVKIVREPALLLSE